MGEAAHQLPSDWRVALKTAIDTGDAYLFAVGVLGFLEPGPPNPEGKPQLEPWQKVALKKFGASWHNRFNRKPRLSIRSGHGCGKTAFLAIIILFVLLGGQPDIKIPVVANSQDQLRDGLWPELQKWMNYLPAAIRPLVKWEKEKVSISAAPEEAFAVRRTASKHRPEALQGIHATNVLIVLEEASGIPEETIEAGAGTLSTPGAAIVAVGNPTRSTGFFWKTHNDPKMRGIWDTMIVNSEDVPRARGHVADIIAMYGKNSNRYRVRVLGEFPLADDDTVISLADVVAAKGRDVKRSWVFPIWGVDVGRHGDDPSTLLKRQGNTLIDVPKLWRNMDGRQVAGRIIAEYEATPNADKPKRINVDIIGVGTSVYDHLRAEGSPCKDIVRGINVAEEPSTGDLDRRLRDELWFKGGAWFKAKDCCIPADLANGNADSQALIEQLIGELTSVTYDFDENGKRVVERKRDMKKRIGHSPDLADGFLLTFEGGSFPREMDDLGRPRWDNDDDSDDSVDQAWGA